MAGDWIAMRTDLADDPGVIQIAAALGMDIYAVVGRLHKVWAWAGSQTTDGHVCVTLPALLSSRSRHASVTLLTFINAHVGVTDFAQAMESVGWLVCTDDGIQFPNFDRWNSQTAKQRILAARRSAQYRAAKTSNSSRSRHAVNVTKASPTVQNRTEENKEEETPTPLQGCPPRKPRKGTAPKESAESVPVSPGLGTPEFLAAWSEWITDRAERRKPLTARAAREQLRLLEPLGPTNAIRCIRDSIAHQWQGLFPDKYAGKPGASQQSKANSDERVMQQIMEGLQHP